MVHDAWVLEQERLRRQERLDKFIEQKADEYARLRKLLSNPAPMLPALAPLSDGSTKQMSGLGQSRHFDLAPITSGLPR